MTQLIHSAFRLTVCGVALFLIGCLGGAGHTRKDALSALWVEPGELSYVNAALLSGLGEANVREIFVPLAELDFAHADGPVLRQPIPALESSLRINVVVGGRLKLDGRDPKQAAQTVGESVQQLLFDAEARGIVPVGVHFDLRTIDSIEIGAEFFNEVRGVLDRSFFLSISLRRSWLKHEDIRSLARTVDFVVPFLYGQRAWEKDSADAWDFKVVRRHLAELEDYGIPYMLGVIGIGNVTHTDRNGKVKNYTAKQAMRTFMWNRSLELKRGFSLEASNRRVYTLVAKEPTRAGGWDIRRKDEVRLIRPMTTDLKQLLDLLAEGDFPRLMGQLYYRLPAPEERMSITVENILNALDANPVEPDLDFEVEVSRRTRRGLMLRFMMSNKNGETTEFSLLDNNYLQITAEKPVFGDIDVGDFYRYDLLQLAAGGEYERMFRSANVVRLHIPILEGQQRVVSGDVEIRLRNPTLRLDAKFMMPDGRTVEFGPYTWEDGVLHGLEEDAEEGASEVSEEAGL